MVRTLASHAGDRGSNPLGSAISSIIQAYLLLTKGDIIKMLYLFLPLLLSFMLIGGCSDNKVEDHVLKEKMDTIEKAKEVEELIQNTVQQTKQNIDEQSR